MSSPVHHDAPAVDGTRLAQLLDEIVALVDAGELEATGPERAHLVGARDCARLVYKI